MGCSRLLPKLNQGFSTLGDVERGKDPVPKANTGQKEEGKVGTFTLGHSGRGRGCAEVVPAPISISPVFERKKPHSAHRVPTNKGFAPAWSHAPRLHRASPASPAQHVGGGGAGRRESKGGGCQEANTVFSGNRQRDEGVKGSINLQRLSASDILTVRASKIHDILLGRR